MSLDEPLELGGSAVETLELGEDEEISLEEEGDSEAATQLKADDDFLLTPLDDAGVDDLDDSGSQVIALDSESFDDAAATMLGSGQPLQEAAALAAAPADMGLGAPGMGMGMGGAAAQPLGATGMVGVAEIPEAPYSIWNVISLVLCFLMLVLTGMMLFDLVRNMWSWDKPYTFNSSLMDALVEALPFFQ